MAGDELNDLLKALQRIRPLLEIGFNSVTMRDILDGGEDAVEAMGWDHYALREHMWREDEHVDVVSRIYEILPKPKD